MEFTNHSCCHMTAAPADGTRRNIIKLTRYRLAVTFNHIQIVFWCAGCWLESERKSWSHELQIFFGEVSSRRPPWHHHSLACANGFARRCTHTRTDKQTHTHREWFCLTVLKSVLQIKRVSLILMCIVCEILSAAIKADGYCVLRRSKSSKKETLISDCYPFHCASPNKRESYQWRYFTYLWNIEYISGDFNIPKTDQHFEFAQSSCSE